MRVIIPVAGEGRRLRPHTFTTPKCLLPIAGKPILGHIIDQLHDLDISEIIFITGPNGRNIEEYIKRNYSFRTSFIEQARLYGLGYAIHIGITKTDEDLLVVLGDTIVELDWKGLISTGKNRLVVKEVADPRAFGVVETRGDRIVALVEKPQNPPTNLAVVGVYYIKDAGRLKECTTEVINKGVTTHGEIQLTDAFELLLQRGVELYTYPTLGWYDCGRKETILATNRFLLEREKRTQAFEGTTIIPPVFIEATALIDHSTIGPYVSIGRGTVVRNSTVRNSIVFDNTKIVSSVIDDSIIGNHSLIDGGDGSYNLGDYSEVAKPPA